MNESSGAISGTPSEAQAAAAHEAFVANERLVIADYTAAKPEDFVGRDARSWFGLALTYSGNFASQWKVHILTTVDVRNFERLYEWSRASTYRWWPNENDVFVGEFAVAGAPQGARGLIIFTANGNTAASAYRTQATDPWTWLDERGNAVAIEARTDTKSEE